MRVFYCDLKINLGYIFFYCVLLPLITWLISLSPISTHTSCIYVIVLFMGSKNFRSFFFMNRCFILFLLFFVVIYEFRNVTKLLTNISLGWAEKKDLIKKLFSYSRNFFVLRVRPKKTNKKFKLFKN